VTAGVMLASAGAVAAAQGTGGTSWTVNPSLNERFTIFGGAAFTTVDAKISTFNKNTGTNEGSIDLDDIGFDSDDVSPLAGGRWRFGSKRNWTIALSYFGNRGSGDSVLDTSFTYEGVTYTVGGTVSSELNTDILIGMIGWAPFKSEKYELGFGVGAHVADLEVKFAGAGIVSGSPVGSVTTKEDVLAPLPNIWVYGGYAFTPKLSLQGAFGWLSLDIGKYDGELLTASGMLEYRLRKNLGLGAGYRYISTDLTVDQSNFKDKFDIDYYGPFVYMTLGFGQ
jgi:hypothetical protein